MRRSCIHVCRKRVRRMSMTSIWKPSRRVSLSGCSALRWDSNADKSSLKQPMVTRQRCHAQTIAHHTIGDCPLEVGDLTGSGTISGTEPGTRGSLLEASNGGKRSYDVSATMKRTFLEDGDRVTIRGWCGGHNLELVGFGECSGTILPAPQPSSPDT